MQIFPAIDLRAGLCVRLRQGDYAQERLAGVNMFDKRGHHAGFVQARNGITKGSNSGQNELVRFRDLVGIAADDGAVTYLLQRFLDAAKVSHAVIDNDDGLHFCHWSLALVMTRRG